MRKKLGQIYKFAGSPALAGAGRITDVDTHSRKATAVISTPAPDRVRDSLNPLGCSLDEYERNPVVFWEHGKVLTKPIGTSENPATGQLSIIKTNSEVLGTCWFTDKFLEAEQIFELVAEGTVRATSVRFTPVTQPVVRKSDTYFDEWMLLEWSWVGIGCNPEAIAATVAKGRLAGKPIVAGIAKSLELYLPKKKIQVPGFKAMEYEAEEMETEETPEGMTTEDAPEQEEEVAENKGYGAQLMEAAYKALSELYTNMETGMGPLENPTVKEAMTAIMDNLSQIKLAMEGAYSENYKAKLGEVCQSCGQEQDEEAMLKSFLSLGATQKFELMGVADRLKSVASSRNLTKFQRDNLSQSARVLDRVFSKAKEQRKEAPKPDQNQEVAKQLSEMFGEMKDLLGTLKSAVPARK